VFVLFLYHRLWAIARRQLAALRRGDFAALERLTEERADLTQELCARVRSWTEPAVEGPMPASVRRRIQRLTVETLEIDEAIKAGLLEALDPVASGPE